MTMVTPPETAVSTAQTIAGISFPHCVLNASGCFNPISFHQLSPLPGGLGGVVTKTTTLEPRPGNPLPRTVELPGVGMLNSIGLQNPGLSSVLTEDVPAFYNCGQLPQIVSIAACSVDEFAEMAHQIEAHPSRPMIQALEVNLSCPNVAKGGVDFGRSPEHIASIISALVQATPLPLFAKLTPNVASMVPMAEAALEAGATGITAINTLLGAHINIHTRKATLPRVSGGYSGPGVFPVALHHVLQLKQAFPSAPIMGVGGIASADNAIAMLMAGASLLQVGTQCFANPSVFVQLNQQLRRFLAAEGVRSVEELVGVAIPGH